jgi:predicted Holliday junction resolvase-like endonuclease
MSSRRRRASEDSMNLSFLDAISCGFGAVVLLLVLTLVFEPVAVKVTRQEVEGRVAALRERLAAVEGEIDTLPVVETPQPTAAELAKLAELQSDLTKIRGEFKASTEPEPESAEEGELRAARQQLTEEMQRLLANYRPPPKDTTVGGIPVDSEYIVFVIDTSGSMRNGNVWETVERILLETLQVYPRIKGIQVLNNEKRYLLEGSGGKWIPDSRANRRRIAAALQNWQVFSSSNPTEGLLEAINRFGTGDRNVSIYLFGDDFDGNVRVESVLREIDRINREDETGRRRVRIHGVAFYTGRGSHDPRRYARFMRALAERNGGTFVALSEADMGPRIRIQGPFGARDGGLPGPVPPARGALAPGAGRPAAGPESDS